MPSQDIPQLHAASILPWFNKAELIDACVLQVQKDLGAYGIALHYSGNSASAYQELFDQLKPQITALLSSGTKLKAMLYRVDLPESQLRDTLAKELDMSAAISRLILWRELQKVVTRFLLSTK